MSTVSLPSDPRQHDEAAHGSLAERATWTPHYTSLRDGICKDLRAAMRAERQFCPDCILETAAVIQDDHHHVSDGWERGDDCDGSYWYWNEHFAVPVSMRGRIDEIVDLIECHDFEVEVGSCGKHECCVSVTLRGR